MRKFPAHQLAETENELVELSSLASRLSIDIGEHSDRIHWDGAVALCAADWLAEIDTMRANLMRAEGLLRAYEMVRKTREGESNDYTGAR